MLNLHIVIVSTRPTRLGPLVADWFVAQARALNLFNIEVVDLAEVNLPLMDEPRHPRLQQYEHAHTKTWSATVANADAFVFVTPEYDFSPPASLINALQFLLVEWAYKPAGFVSYGGVSAGTRGVQGSKSTLTSLNVMPIAQAVAIPFFTNYINKESNTFDPGEVQAQAAKVMLEELLKWATALKPLRN